MTDSASWSELWANLPIFKDAILTGGLAGALLGFIGRAPDVRLLMAAG